MTAQQFSIETTNGIHDITIESAGSGIRTENGESDIELKSSGDNIIHFDNSAESDGDGITVEDSSRVTLNAENGMNEISSQIKQDGVGDGVRIEGNGQVEVNGRYNTISVGDDGLYIHEISDANSKIEITATGADVNGVGNAINGKMVFTQTEQERLMLYQMAVETSFTERKTPYMQVVRERLPLVRPQRLTVKVFLY